LQYERKVKVQHQSKAYDVIVIGSGSGSIIVDRALAQGLSVAWLDKGPLGGTCDNLGCVPSKMIIASADRVVEIQEANKLGIEAQVLEVDFQAIMQRMRRVRAEGQEHRRKGIAQAERLDFYEMEGHFVDQRVLQVGEDRIEGQKIFVVSGARPLVPPIEGLERVPYLDNETVLELDERPDSLLIVGGGYIGCEYAHFFAAMGTDVTIVQRNRYLLPKEEPEISSLLRQVLSRRAHVHVDTEVVRVRQEDGHVLVTATNRSDGEQEEFRAQQVMIAAGRKPNSDLLCVENAGIETDSRGYIRVNEYLETNVPGIWALGDAIGRQMFKHVANREARFAWRNSQHEDKVAVDYGLAPHAVFTHPQIASVGLMEAEAKKNGEILIGRAPYTSVVKGVALKAEEGFAKAVVDAESRRILGFHIIGPYAPILIQEVIDIMATDGRASAVSFGMHIHPALPELVVGTMQTLAPPE
jgi:dihydrolipoamide dehydrogenase